MFTVRILMKIWFSGIPVIQNLEVGSGLREHLQTLGIPFTSNLSEPIISFDDQIRSFIKGEGPLSKVVASDAFFLHQTSVETRPNYPDLEISFTQGNDSLWALSTFSRSKSEVSTAMKGVNAATSFTIHVTPVHTTSIGTVRLNSSDPFAHPLIDPRILSDSQKEDIRRIYEGIQLSLQLVKSPAMRAINANLAMQPLSYCNHTTYLSEAYWYCLIPYITNHNNHPVSTCRMGPDPQNGDVVNHELKVYGVENLRVADNGVVPIPPTNHVNSVAYLVGERGAALIREQHERSDM